MNTYMWDSPFTQQHLAVLRTLRVSVVPPVAKQLACGDHGVGAMASLDQIVSNVKQTLEGCGFKC